MSTLAEKLGIKNDRTVGIVANEEVDDFPPCSALNLPQSTELWSTADVVLWPAATEEAVRSGVEANREAFAAASVVWLCYKKGNAASINRDKLWIILADYDWKAVSQVSLNDEWSALRIRPMNPEEKQAK